MLPSFSLLGIEVFLQLWHLKGAWVVLLPLVVIVIGIVELRLRNDVFVSIGVLILLLFGLLLVLLVALFLLLLPLLLQEVVHIALSQVVFAFLPLA